MLKRMETGNHTAGGGWVLSGPGLWVLPLDAERRRASFPQRLSLDLKQHSDSCASAKLTSFSMNHTWNLHLVSHTLNSGKNMTQFYSFYELNPKTRCFALLWQAVWVLLSHTSQGHTHHDPSPCTLLPLCSHPPTGSCLLLPIPYSDKSPLLLLYCYSYFCASHSSGQESFKNLNYFVARHGAVFLKVAFLFGTSSFPTVSGFMSLLKAFRFPVLSSQARTAHRYGYIYLSFHNVEPLRCFQFLLITHLESLALSLCFHFWAKQASRMGCVLIICYSLGSFQLKCSVGNITASPETQFLALATDC